MTSHRPPDWPLVEDLKLREREILAQFAEGKSDREIAKALVLSLSTVKWYARQIYGKLGVDNRRMAVQRGQELGLFGSLPSPAPQPELPTFLTPFVGREQEIQDICHFLREEEHRLVTLVGSGGIGKTRLAIQIVHILAEQQPRTFVDGFYFISLAGLTAPASIVTAIGTALGISFSQGSNPQRQLHDALNAKRMLLVLDNMEHLLGNQEFDSTAFLLDLLHAAPHLKVIVTSRSRLGVQSEQLYPVGGLAYPDPAVEAIHDVGDFSAVQLLFQHIQRVQPSYRIQGDDSRAIVQICQLLEGILWLLFLQRIGYV